MTPSDGYDVLQAHLEHLQTDLAEVKSDVKDLIRDQKSQGESFARKDLCQDAQARIHARIDECATKTEMQSIQTSLDGIRKPLYVIGAAVIANLVQILFTALQKAPQITGIAGQ